MSDATVTPDAAPARPATAPLARLAIAGLLLCAAAALFWPRSATQADAPGGFVIDGRGQPVPLASRFTPVTLVHFWATWCPPCVEEAPALDRLERDFAAPGKLTVLRIAVADAPERVKTFLQGHDRDVLFDPNWDVAHRYGTVQLPETYLLVNGKVVRKFVGSADWDAADVRAQLRAWRDR